MTQGTDFLKTAVIEPYPHPFPFHSIQYRIWTMMGCIRLITTGLLLATMISQGHASNICDVFYAPYDSRLGGLMLNLSGKGELVLARPPHVEAELSHQELVSMLCEDSPCIGIKDKEGLGPFELLNISAVLQDVALILSRPDNDYVIWRRNFEYPECAPSGEQ